MQIHKTVENQKDTVIYNGYGFTIFSVLFAVFCISGAFASDRTLNLIVSYYNVKINLNVIFCAKNEIHYFGIASNNN